MKYFSEHIFVCMSDSICTCSARVSRGPVGWMDGLMLLLIYLIRNTEWMYYSHVHRVGTKLSNTVQKTERNGAHFQ